MRMNKKDWEGRVRQEEWKMRVKKKPKTNDPGGNKSVNVKKEKFKKINK